MADSSLYSGVRGRSIVRLLFLASELWGKHRASLAPDLPPAVVSALDAIQAAIATIMLVNPPGPE